MKLKSISLFSALVIMLSCGLDAKESTQKSMIRELDVLKHSFSLRYAPTEWKKDLYGWNIDDVFNQAKKRIYDEHPSKAKQFQKIIKQVFDSTKDYHVTVSAYSTESAYFPLLLRGSNRRYFVASILNQDPKYAEIGVGDEVISINGIPIRDVIEKLIDDELAGDRTLTGYALAEEMLFERSGRYCQTVPSGTFRLTVKHKGDEFKTHYLLSWGYNKEYIKESVKQKGKALQLTKVGNPSNGILNRNYSVELAKSFTQNLAKSTGDEPKDSREKGMLPPLGKILWESSLESQFYAYVFENSFEQCLGYLRISSFDGDADDITEIIPIIEKLSLDAEALIIDITNNPGGNIFYMYALLSLFTDEPMDVLPERSVINQQDVYQALMLANECNNYYHYDNKELTEEFMGYPVNDDTRSDIVKYARAVDYYWQKGKHFTDLLRMISVIHPHPAIHYDKPIIVLIDERDFSCADIFPATLQDNKRAILFGQKTAGAAGHFVKYTYPSQFGIRNYSLTASVVYRLDGNPIENIGVTPDIPYEVSVKDLIDNYSDYTKAVNEAVHGMTQ